MLQLRNATPFQGSLLLLPDEDGIDTLFAVVKGTFRLRPGLAVAEAQVPIAAADQHHGDPAASSIRVPSDVCLGKPGTDVVLLGSAWAPGGRPAWHADVSVEVGPLAKRARVHGDRVWRATATGTAVAWVAPFERMPLAWERSFGGHDVTERGPAAEPRNPVGTGFRARDGAGPYDGMPLPNVEDPAALITSWRETPPPCGFAPVAAHWEPRKSFAGTYDDAWQRERAPYLPADFDPRFFHLAPAGLASARPLEGGEPVRLRGVTPDGELSFHLPALRVEAAFRLDGGTEVRPAALDTVLLEPDAERVVLVWRARLRCDKKALKVREVAVKAAGTVA